MLARPRRSVLYMPGSNAKALAKAATLPADALILDLEDSVSPDAKVAARAQVVEAAKGDFGGREVVIRVNGAAYALGRGRPHRRRRGRSRRHSPAQGRRSRGHHARRAHVARERRAGEDPALGDDGDAERDPERRLDRRGRRRLGLAADGAGHGPQRSRQGDARAADPRPPHHDRLARQLRRRGARPRLSTSSTASTTTSRISTASAPNACRAATWASTARR